LAEYAAKMTCGKSEKAIAMLAKSCYDDPNKTVKSEDSAMKRMES